MPAGHSKPLCMQQQEGTEEQLAEAERRRQDAQAQAKSSQVCPCMVQCHIAGFADQFLAVQA